MPFEGLRRVLQLTPVQKPCLFFFLFWRERNVSEFCGRTEKHSLHREGTDMNWFWLVDANVRRG